MLFDIMPKGYLINASDIDPNYADKCIFGIIKTPDILGTTKMFLLGDVFLRNFYSVFDYDNNSIMLGVNLHSKEYVGIKKQSSIVWVYLTIMLIEIPLCSFFI